MACFIASLAPRSRAHLSSDLDKVLAVLYLFALFASLPRQDLSSTGRRPH